MLAGVQVLNGGHTLAGQMYRMTTCEITYGPLNCDFVFRADNECAVKVLLLLSFFLSSLCPALFSSDFGLLRHRGRSRISSFLQQLASRSNFEKLMILLWVQGRLCS